jgi:hypothetical protein
MRIQSEIEADFLGVTHLNLILVGELSFRKNTVTHSHNDVIGHSVQLLRLQTPFSLRILFSFRPNFSNIAKLAKTAHNKPTDTHHSSTSIVVLFSLIPIASIFESAPIVPVEDRYLLDPLYVPRKHVRR